MREGHTYRAQCSKVFRGQRRVIAVELKGDAALKLPIDFNIKVNLGPVRSGDYGYLALSLFLDQARHPRGVESDRAKSRFFRILVVLEPAFLQTRGGGGRKSKRGLSSRGCLYTCCVALQSLLTLYGRPWQPSARGQ